MATKTDSAAHDTPQTDSTPEAYCMKCKQKRPMVDAKETTMKNGRPAMQSKCPVCGTTLNRILPSK